MKRSGFTLIELMIVLAIIAALAAILTPMGMNALNRAKATQYVADVRNIKAAAQIYYFDKTGVPTTWSAFSGYLNTGELTVGVDKFTITNNTTGNVFEITASGLNSSIVTQLELAWQSEGLESTTANSATFKFTF